MIKQLNSDESNLLYKARRGALEDYQQANVDFYPYETHALVACHESICTLPAHAISHSLIVERADVASAYLYGHMNFDVFVKQPLPSSKKKVAYLGHICKLNISMYGIKPARKIWGSLLANYILARNF